MRYCSEDAPRTGERNVNLNKNTSENDALNKIFYSSNIFNKFERSCICATQKNYFFEFKFGKKTSFSSSKS